MDFDGEQVMFQSRPYLQVKLILYINKTKLTNYMIEVKSIKTDPCEVIAYKKILSGYRLLRDLFSI